MKKILKWIGIAALAFIALGIIAVATDDKATATSKPTELAYVVSSKKITGSQLDYRVTVQDRISQESVIEIARKLKEESGFKDNIVCFFDIKAFSPSAAWASASYLPQCSECMTEKDADGNPIEYRLIGVTKSYADSLSRLTLDSIENKKLIASYLEDIMHCKSELFVVNNDPSKVLLGQNFLNGGHLVQWLKLKTVAGEKRYYFHDEEPGKENYLVMDEAKKIVDFRDYQDKSWMAYGYE